MNATYPQTDNQRSSEISLKFGQMNCGKCVVTATRGPDLIIERKVNLESDEQCEAFACDAAGECDDFETVIGELLNQLTLHRNKQVGPIMCNLADVKVRKLEWLWPERIPLGKLTLLFGDPGLGKSFLTVDMAARVSTGTPWPDNTPCVEGDVIMVNAEDDVEDTIAPRVFAAHGDLSRVTTIKGVRTGARSGATCSITLADINHWKTALDQKPDTRLLVIDPVSAFLATADSHKNAEIRALMSPLVQLAAERRVAVVVVTHMNKSTGGRAISRSIGSIAFVGAARAAHLIVEDKDDPKRRLFLPAKNNLSSNDNSGLAYRVIDGTVSWEHAPVDMQADDALAATEGQQARVSRKDAAVEWLQKLLIHAPMSASKIKEQATEAGISWGSVRRAQQALGIVPDKIGFNGSWQWALPARKSAA